MARKRFPRPDRFPRRGLPSVRAPTAPISSERDPEIPQSSADIPDFASSLTIRTPRVLPQLPTRAPAYHSNSARPSSDSQSEESTAPDLSTDRLPPKSGLPLLANVPPPAQVRSLPASEPSSRRSDRNSCRTPVDSCLLIA